MLKVTTTTPTSTTGLTVQSFVEQLI